MDIIPTAPRNLPENGNSEGKADLKEKANFEEKANLKVVKNLREVKKETMRGQC
jgi:hypothetical protein